MQLWALPSLHLGVNVLLSASSSNPAALVINLSGEVCPLWSSLMSIFAESRDLLHFGEGSGHLSCTALSSLASIQSPTGAGCRARRKLDTLASILTHVEVYRSSRTLLGLGGPKKIILGDPPPFLLSLFLGKNDRICSNFSEI